MKRSLFVLGCALLVLVSAVTAQAQEQPARLRVAHASPNAQGVDILIDGEVAFDNIPFNHVTGYEPAPAGSLTVRVVPAGADEPVLAELPVEIQAGQDYTVIVAGKAPLIEPVLLQDNNTLPPASQVRLRFIHLSPNVPEVDLARQAGSQLFSNVPYKNPGTYVSVTPGTYNLEVQIAGTGVTALDAPEVTLTGGQVYTIFMTGSAGGIPGLQALLSVDAGETVAAVPSTVPETAPTSTPGITPTAVAQATAAPTPAATLAATIPATATMAATVPATVTIAATVPATATIAATVPATATVTEEDGIEPATMPTTGSEAASPIELVVLVLGLTLVIAIGLAGLSSTRRRSL